MLTIVMTAAQAEPQRGWGGPLAILAAFAGIGLIHLFMERRRSPSPTPPRGRRSGVNSQVTAGSDPVDPGADPGWWGQIVEVNGVRMRKVRQVWRTGSTRLPENAAEPPEDDGVDLALDGPGEAASEPQSLDAWLAEHDGQAGTNELIRQAAARYRVSESTAKRALRQVRRGPGRAG
ncbi:hypothetical protein [Actinoplanes sp. NPDC049316]|uniref:hypothetical protein n=1 Tax=Actinoplanes sp. NPDC049316 TaxID=3154727 RepID=UPI0034358AA7